MERYVIRGGEVGYERLQVLARSWEPTTAALLERAGLQPGMTCLDLGSGAGDVTFELARQVGGEGRVVGIDMDDEKVDLARASAAAQGVPNVEFRALSIYDWSEPDSYDLVYCRNVLQHLSRPVDVLRSMWSAVRPGGSIVVEDADFEGSFCDPPNADFDFWVQAYQRVLSSSGGDPLMGRKLHRLFTAADIPAPTVTVVQRADVTGEAKTLPHSTIDLTADAIVANGIATRDEVDAALKGLLELAADPGTIFGSPRIFQAWAGRRPR